MGYKVIVSSSANRDIAVCLEYLLEEKQSPQAAGNLLDDYDITLKRLELVAESLKYCDNPRLAEFGYKRINFESHNYFMMYRVIGEEILVDRIFHGLQDYENKMI